MATNVMSTPTSNQPSDTPVGLDSPEGCDGVRRAVAASRILAVTSRDRVAMVERPAA